MHIYQKQTKGIPRAAPIALTERARRMPMDSLRSMTELSKIESGSRRIDLPGAIRAKMENAFGADLSGLRLYESEKVSDAGADALAQGSRIAFAPGQANLFSLEGQALLGHELSHIVSQAKNEVHGSGLLENPSLEARADREGWLAASGRSAVPETGTSAPIDIGAGTYGVPVQACRRNQNKPLGADKIKPDQPVLDAMGFAGAVQEVIEGVSSKLEDLSLTPETPDDNGEKKPYLGTTGKIAGKMNAKLKSTMESDVGSTVSGAMKLAGRAKGAYDNATKIGKAIHDPKKTAVEKLTDVTRLGTGIVGNVADSAGVVTKQLSKRRLVPESVPTTIGTIGADAKFISDTVGGFQKLEDIVENDRMDDMDAGLATADTVLGWEKKIASVAERNLKTFAKGSKAQKIASKIVPGLKGEIDIFSGVTRMAQSVRQRKQAISDRIAGEQVEQTIDEQRPDRLDDDMQRNDRLIRSIASNVRGAADVHKAQSIQKTVDAFFQTATGAYGLTAECGKSVQALNEIARSGFGLVTAGHTEQMRKVARERNLDNLRLRTVIERAITQAEGRESDARFRAGEIANQVRSGVRGAKSDRVAGMLMTLQAINAFEQLTLQDDSEGQRARQLGQDMGIDTDEYGRLRDRNFAVSHMNADFNDRDSLEKQMDAAEAQQYGEEHIVAAELQRQEARKNEAEEARRQAERNRRISDAPDGAPPPTEFTPLLHNNEEADNELPLTTDNEEADNESFQLVDNEEDADESFQLADNEEDGDESFWQIDDEESSLLSYQALDSDIPERSATADAKLPWYKRVWHGILNAGNSLIRSHDRARDSFINESEQFDKLSRWRKAKLIAWNPLSWIASKTGHGKAETAKRNERARSDNRLVEWILQNPGAIQTDENGQIIGLSLPTRRRLH